MKRKFFKLGLFLTLGLTTTVFYSCEKNDNGDESSNVSKIIATNVVNGSPEIVTVKAEVSWYNGNNYEYYTIAEAPYKDNGFTLELPATVPAQYLDSIMENGDEVFIKGITVSDKTVIGTSFECFDAYDKNDDSIGGLYYLSVDDNGNGSEAWWFYVDKEVTINGQNKQEYEDFNEVDISIFNNLTLKKGWNIIYLTVTHVYNQSTQIDTYTNTFSNQKPSGVTLKWYFDSFNSQNYAATLKSTNSFSKGKSFFSKVKQIKY